MGVFDNPRSAEWNVFKSRTKTRLEASQRGAPRASQESPRRRLLGILRGAIKDPPFLIDTLEDGPKRARKAPEMAPRRPQERPIAPLKDPKKRFVGPQKGKLK